MGMGAWVGQGRALGRAIDRAMRRAIAGVLWPIWAKNGKPTILHKITEMKGVEKRGWGNCL
jgi:hypothetical protein